MWCVSTAQWSVKEESHLSLAACRARQGKLRTHLSGELRDSDGLELICLCCWCYACFIFVCVFIYLCAYITRSLCFCLSVSLWICHHTVAVSCCCCECVLQPIEAESTVFNGPSYRGPHLGAAVWNTVRREVSIVSCSIQVPGSSIEGRRGFCLPPCCCLSLVSLTWPSGSVVLLLLCFDAKYRWVGKRESLSTSCALSERTLPVCIYLETWSDNLVRLYSAVTFLKWCLKNTLYAAGQLSSIFRSSFTARVLFFLIRQPTILQPIMWFTRHTPDWRQCSP